jgi:tetratricopeptide (TPR) repeat protein
MRRDFLICFLLAGITLAIYWPARNFDLIYFDDPLLLTDSAPVKAGLTWASLQWAFTSVVIANWHPVTNLSFLLVAEFFGVAPGAHHLANVFIHAANAVLLFLLLRELTSAKWRSAVVAAIFAWHPLRVESVAWIAERKDVLCAFFFLLSLFFYAKFAAAKKIQNGKYRIFFYASIATFVLSLLSKPMAVTLPFVLLLLDIWPLARVESYKLKVAGSARKIFQPAAFNMQLVTEKWPFFALTIIFCIATFWIQHDYAAMTPWDKLGLDARVANAISGYVNYLAKLFWPLNFAAIYPYPKSYDVTQTILKAAFLVAISIGCLQNLARRPWLAVGWFWFLITALPVIGIIQVGEQSMADRYTYLPLIGPVIAVVWSIAEIFFPTRAGKNFFAATTVLILCTLAVLSERQLQFWRNTILLFEHNVAVTPENASAHFTLGLGFEHAGETNRAIVEYRVAKMISPADLQVRSSLANLFFERGQFFAAETEYDELLALAPQNFSTHLNLANVFAAQNRVDEEISELNQAVRLNPNSVEALNNLAWALATSPRADLRDGNRAVQLAQRACELTQFQKTIYIGTLAAAFAEAGKFDDAILTAQRACELAAKNSETNLFQRNQELLKLYRAHKTAKEEL